ncbi:MAG: sensor histidine kinase [Culicoidibacterales bacterium]
MMFPFISRTKKWLISSIFGLFILGQIFGFFFLTGQFTRFKVDNLLPQLQTIATEVGKGRPFPTKPLPMLLRVVDADGNLLLPKSVNSLTVTPFWPTIQKTLTTSPYYAKIHELPELNNQSLLLVIPIPNTTQYLIGIAPVGDLMTALLSFLIAFTIIFGIGSSLIALLLYLYHRETQHLLKLQKNYVATMTHELKSPITAIRALTETLQDHVITDEQTKQDYLQIIHQENQKLAYLVNDALTLAAIQSLTIEQLNLEKMNLIPNLNSFFATYYALAQARQFNFIIDESFEKLPSIYVDQARLEQIFSLLLDNAFKFCFPQGTITLSAVVKPSQVVIYLSNTGVVIPPEVIPILFDRFATISSHENPEGSGLGLAIVKEILALFGGTIWLESSTVEQTIFAFSLPRR